MKISLTLFIVFVSACLFGQKYSITEKTILCHQVIKYESLIKKELIPKEFLSSLGIYKPETITDDNFLELKKYSRKLDSIYKGLNQNDTVKGNDKGFVDVTNPPILGATWQSNLIMGLTDFLLERAKEEFTYAFVDDLAKMFVISHKDSLNTVIKYQKIFLKNTFVNFKNVIERTEQYTYKNYVPALRAAIIQDYNNLPFTILKSGLEINTPITPDTKIVLNKIMDILQSITQGQDPFFALSKLCDPKMLHDINDKTLKDGLQIIGTLSFEQYYIMQTSPTVNFEQITTLKDLLINEELRVIFLTILDNQINQNQHFICGNVNKELSIIELSKCFDKIKTIVLEINNSENDSTRNINYVNYINSILYTFVTVSNLFENENTDWKTTLAVLDLLLEIQKSVIEKNYTQSVILVISLLKPEIKDEMVIKFMTFAANLAEAKSKDDVELALKTFASPVGSYRAKRLKEGKYPFSVSLNSYLGYNFGKEYLINSDDDVDMTSSFYQSIYLPVGIEVDWSTRCKGISTIGLYASPIDLGTLASYRIHNQEWDSLSVSNSSELSYRTILAPTAAFVFGITKNKPITFTVGYQYAPEQRILKDNVLNIEEKISVHHIFINISMDLTLLNF